MFDKFPTIETKRLILKEVTENHIYDLYQTLSKKEVVQYMGIPQAKTIDDAYGELSWYQKIFQTKTGIRFGLFLKENNHLIGSCGYKNLDQNSRKAEIGYELNSEFWHRGFMKEAIIPIIDYGFKTLNLNRIYAEADLRNIASIILLKKMGFNEEGIMHEAEYENGEFIDLIYLALLKREYIKLNTHK